MGYKQFIYYLFVTIQLSPIIPVLAKEKNQKETIPPAAREMRAVWVATVANIDWPSRPGLSTGELKKEALAILDRVKELNLNAVIFQARPQADAFYKSDLEPWSYYLTGEQGKALDPFFDPLEFWIQEAHSRGLELHAWLNPYRAGHSAMRGELAPSSIVKAKPHLVRKLGNQGYYWMDPSLKEGQEHTFAVIMDIIKRYDIDGIQFDDYFYPYREYNDGLDFPDSSSYSEYKSKGGKLPLGDWRRNAVNKLIERVYKGIKKEKPFVKFGISPFGTYRPGYPASFTAGFDAYDVLYADSKLWLNKGWIDYLAPQLYWPISRVQLSYPLLLSWWNSENTKGRHMWPGLFVRMEVDRREMTREILSQVMVTRGMVKDRPGVMLFSMQSLRQNDSSGAGLALKNGPFSSGALVPAYPWLDNKPPKAPALKAEVSDSSVKFSWTPEGKEKPFQYVLYTKKGNRWNYDILPAAATSVSKSLEGEKITAAAISAVDRCGNESKLDIINVNN